jgi:hypothetical protein
MRVEMKDDWEEVKEFLGSLQKYSNEIAKGTNVECLTEIMEFRETLTNESHRAAALMATAYIDEQLKALLKKLFVNDHKITDSLLKSSGALGSFSARIDMAYSLGLIPKNIRDDLELMRKIRNDFAHTAKHLSFDCEPIKSRCLMLRSIVVPKVLDAHGRFLRSAILAATTIETTKINTIQTEAAPNHDDTENAKQVESVIAFIKKHFDIDMEAALKLSAK